MLRALRGETGAVDVLEGGERDTNDLLSCSHYPLKGLAAGRVAGAIPSQVKSSHLYLYSAFNNTNCNKALHNIKIGKFVNNVK